MTLTTIFAGNQAYALSFVFVFGLLWGSFLNVVIHRLPLGKSVVFPRSSCPKCATPITWFENIPLLSWLVLRGKCSHCGVRISLRYPLVELLTAILFTLVAARQPHLYSIFFQFWFIGSLIACTFIDIDHWILPDKITLPGILLGFLASFLPEELGWLNSLTGILFGGGLLYFVAWAYERWAKRDGLGGGDIKFLAMVGAFLGIKGAFTTLIISSMLGSLIGIFLISIRGKKSGTAIQFGPFLAIGALFAFFFGEQFWQWYFGNG